MREKATWMHPRSMRWQPLDYVLVRMRDRQDVLVTKAIRDATGWTDHRLVVSQMRLRLQPRRRPQAEISAQLTLVPLRPLSPRGLWPSVSADASTNGVTKTTIRAGQLLMGEWAHWLTGRRTRFRAPQHDLAPITHTPGFTNSGEKEEPSPYDAQSTGQPLDTHSTYTGPTAWSGVSVRSAAFQATVSKKP
ncbi:unnamed protein product [Schistocephalus solidus]|uniref:Endo/exonuclease/phosphatase domain-containing protein n=1 Tax=Schistocephalus solidus TaxID=70667 RepID=A0A183TN65_SCHSO|nr:unnamed protein product [Schistocephalus solidus]